MAQLVTITGPTAEPVTLETLKNQVRIDVDDDDDYLDLCIATATRRAQTITGRRIMSQTVELRLDSFPSGGFSLEAYPIQSVDSVKYDDLSDVEQTLAASQYETDLERLNGWIQPVSTVDSWPDTYEKLAAVRIRMTVGYATAAAVPREIAAAVTLLAAHYERNREPTSTMAELPVPESFRELLNDYAVFPLG